jgi:hypothetical protein
MDWYRPGDMDAQVVERPRAGPRESDPADPARLGDFKLDAAATRIDRVRADLAALKAARPAEYRRLRDGLQRVLDQ